MYEEEHRSFPLRDFLLKLILIIIFVLLLVWLLPIPNLSGIKNQIFNANVQEMKDAAISYFTTERLPKNEGDSVTLTLQEMLDMKLLLPFTDKDGKSCDTLNSYVTLTKKENEYEMKVYLKCNGEEDYIIVHLGCYSYCESAICEKEEAKKEEPKGQRGDGKSGKTPTPTPTPTPKPTPTPTPTPVSGGPSCSLIVSGTVGDNDWYLSDATVKFKSKTTTNPGATISAYGIGTKQTYAKNNSFKVSNDGVTKVYGYVKDSKGKTATCSVVVKKDTTKPNCSLSVLSGTMNADGKYITDVKVGFNSKTDATSGISKFGVDTASKANYNSKTNYTVTKIGTTKVYGYVKDNAGNTQICSKEVTKVKVEEDKKSEPSCSLEVTGTLGNNNWYVSNATVKFKSKATTNGAKITSFGLGTKQNYDGNTSYVISSDGTHTIYGYVKDSKGNTALCSVNVKRDATKPNCSLDAAGTYKDGHYISDVKVSFASKNDKTSGVAVYGIGKSEIYTNNTSYTISASGSHTVYGYVRDNAGNKNVCSISFTKKDIEYEYEYSKHIEEKWSDWSSWTTKTYSKSNPPKFEKTSTKEVVDLGGTKQLKEYKYTVGKPVYGTVKDVVLTVNEKVCKGYEYYRTSSSTTKTYAVNVSSGNEGWVYQGTVVTTTAKQPAPDTISKKYVLYGMDYSSCDVECTSGARYKWKVYTRKAEVVYITDSGEMKTSSGVKVECSGYETKKVKVLADTTTIIGYEEIRTPVYETIYKYKYRTRSLIQKEQTLITWSAKVNDSSLINNGYKMTGNKRIKN